MMNEIVLIRGAGEHASGTAHRLFKAGFRILMTELEMPLCVRRMVSFSSAIFGGTAEVEGVIGKKIDSIDALDWNVVNVIIDPNLNSLRILKPSILIDARLKKRDIETRKGDASFVIGLGPGFTAGIHCDVVIETNRGHNLGKIIFNGEAEPDTGTPGSIRGETEYRILRAPCDGIFKSLRNIGDAVEKGDAVCRVGEREISSLLKGVVRGLLHDEINVSQNTKLGDIDPRLEPSYCFTLSDKTRTISGGVLEAILSNKSGRL